MDIETRRKKALARMVRRGEYIPPGYDPAWKWVSGPMDGWDSNESPVCLVLDEQQMRKLGTLPPDLRGPLRQRANGVEPNDLTAMSWDGLRKYVWERDGGRCFVCGVCMSDIADYECGHIIDRMVGGADRATNLVVMHGLCNRLKSAHRTREEFVVWITEFTGMVRTMMRAGRVTT